MRKGSNYLSSAGQECIQKLGRNTLIFSPKGATMAPKGNHDQLNGYWKRYGMFTIRLHLVKRSYYVNYSTAFQTIDLHQAFVRLFNSIYAMLCL